MRAKKSKSTVQIHRQAPQPIVSVPQNELQDLYDKEAELGVLEDRVNRSKPILETIYSKIKLK
jgi:predicted NAD/FAD-binding protein